MQTRSRALAIVLLALGLARLFLLLARPLWHDELFTVWVSRLPFPSLLAALRVDSGPPLFYVLEKPLVHLVEAFALSDRSVRLLSLAAAVLLAALSRGLRSAPSRRLFLLLAAVSPLLLLYAAEARPYALLALLGLVLFRLAVEARPTPAVLAATTLVAAIALYTHYLALFLVAALALSASLERRARTVAALVGGLALWLPWAPAMWAQPAAATAWMREGVLPSLGGWLAALGGAGRIPSPLGPPLPALLLGLGGAAGVFALAAVFRSPGETGARRPAATVLLFLALVLLASPWRPVAFAGRSELAVLPIWFWAMARASDGGLVARRAGTAVVLVGALSSALVLTRVPRGDSESVPAIEAVGRLARPDDALIAGAGFYLPARLAADRGALRLSLRSFPEELAAHPGWFAAAAPTPADFRRLEEMLSATRSGARVFLLLSPLYDSPDLLRTLSTRGSAERIPTAPDVLLLRWSEASGPNR